ncbi:MAG: glycosyltransferase family 4 protein [Verrucomicrobiae bacterium]|nr:glycosyltransferase family 4 protein [Verrucomicrobiae bacterium]
MARIAIADSCARYDGRDMATRALGGTETSVIQLAEALAWRGHRVTCHTPGAARVEHRGVGWSPLADGAPETCDLLIAVQRPELLDFVRRPRARVLWSVWASRNLASWRYLFPMWRLRPRVVHTSRFQVHEYPFWLPAGRPTAVIPLGLPDAVRGLAALPAAPPPRAVFASRPVRGLRQLIRLWADAIVPAVPGAELHIYGVRDASHRFGDPWEETERRLGQFLPEGLPAEALASLKPHPPATREALWDAVRRCRALLYPGHASEAFCLAVAEAQALGVPAVVRPIAVMPERVIDGITGFVARDDREFADRAIALLSDDALWRRQHADALRLQQGSSWDEVAARFEALIGAAQ